MPVLLRFATPLDVLACRWAISPARETMSAVRLLTQPHRQGYHRPWLRAVAPALTSLDLTPLFQVMPETGYSPDFLSPPPTGPTATFADELAQVRATPLPQLRTELRHCGPRAAALRAHPAKARDLLADTLEACWTHLVEPWWPRIRDVLVADIAHRTRVLADGGLAAVFAGLHRKVGWRDNTVTIDIAYDGEREVDGAGIVLLPSAFEWPNVGVMLDRPWLPTIDYPARGIAALWETRQAPPDALARLVGRTRATLLAALTEPLTTGGLARRCGLPDSSVSEALTILRDAGLVSTDRMGRYRQHTRTPLGTELLGRGET